VLGSALVFAFYPWFASPQPVASTPYAPDVQTPGKQILLDDGRGLIHLDVIVTDQSGRLAPGLRFSDFTLLDNGRPQTILSFHTFDEAAKPNPPVKIILVVDTLALPGRLPSDERLAVEAYLQKTGGHLVQPVSLYELDGSGFWAVGSPSDDGNILAADLAHSQNFHELRSFRSTLRGDTWKWLDENDTPSLEALKALGQIATTERQIPGRKLLIWVGPGWGIGSGDYADRTVSKEDTFYAIRWFSGLLREARITLYSLSVGETEPAQLYLSYLHGVSSAEQASFMNMYRKVLAEQSGGHVLNTGFDLVSQIESCVHEPNTFYTLSFNPPPAALPNEYHDLTVQIDKPGLSARTKTGYYDQPYYWDQTAQTVRGITSEQLGKLLTSLHGEPDEKIARQLSALLLTDRPDSTAVASWRASLHGKSAQQELTALTDLSAFLNPAPSTVITDPPPGTDEQKTMISLAADYLAKTIPKLPDFYARRTTVRYQDTPPVNEGDTRISYETLHVALTANETVVYRDGKEFVDSDAANHKKQKMTDRSLVTYGTFGPILKLAQDIFATTATLTWARWEQDAGSKRAVFRYAFPVQKSRYETWGCCLPDGDGANDFDMIVPYHGEVAIEPLSGAVVRLVAMADLGAFTPLLRSDIAVAYGRIELGGKTYICPVKSVSVMTSRSVTFLREWDEGFRTYGPYATTMNDITFDSYHMFKAQSRMLVGVNPSPDQSNTKTPHP
ncbi:MAG: VWA domain-containing protein, partial [Silvibacterium sp.]